MFTLIGQRENLSTLDLIFKRSIKNPTIQTQRIPFNLFQQKYFDVSRKWKSIRGCRMPDIVISIQFILINFFQLIQIVQSINKNNSYWQQDFNLD